MKKQSTLTKYIYAANRWWLSMLLGILFIITGVWVMTTLLENYTTLSILFSLVLLANGTMEICSAVSIHHDSNRPMLMGGIIDVATAVILISAPLLNFLLVSFFIGFAPIFRSAIAIDPHFDLHKSYDKKWGILLLMGITGVIVSLVLLERSVAGFTMAFYTGFTFITIGAFRIILGFRLKSGKNRALRH